MVTAPTVNLPDQEQVEAADGDGTPEAITGSRDATGKFRRTLEALEDLAEAGVARLTDAHERAIKAAREAAGQLNGNGKGNGNGKAH